MMYEQYATLAHSNAVPAHVARSNDQSRESGLNPSSPALQVLHDFRLFPPSALPDKLSVEQALELFKVLQMRYLLVEDIRGDFQGILAASDLLGPNLMTKLRQYQLLPDELQVRDLMIPRGKLFSIPYSSLRSAKVGDVLHTFEVTGQPFLCVHDGDTPSSSNLRGVFCARDLGERLGVQWAPPLRARSFSELSSTLLGRAELPD